MSEIRFKKQREPKTKHVFLDIRTGNELKMAGVKKLFRDVLEHHHGALVDDNRVVTKFDPSNALAGKLLVPCEQNPICRMCELDQAGADHPYMHYSGSHNPLVTIITDSISTAEDIHGGIAKASYARDIFNLVAKYAPELGILESDVRWLSITRCAARDGKNVNFKTKGSKCRYYLIQDLLTYPPKLVIPVGTTVLGLLSHKSNVQDWEGKILTYRGWPDDWLTNADFCLPRPSLTDPKKTTVGHPLFGRPPRLRIPMYPIQAPRLVYMAQNSALREQWKAKVKQGLTLAKDGVAVKSYDRPWYKIFQDPKQVENALKKLAATVKKYPGTVVAYDTETTGLNQWPYYFYDGRMEASAIRLSERPAIVFIMFRWTDPETKEPKAIGFPWDYGETKIDGNISPASPLYGHTRKLAPFLLDVLYNSTLVGHNLTFDILFTYATVPGACLDWLADAAVYDTWHMAYCYHQQRGSLGLEVITYDYAPEMAGYEEEMTLLIDLHREMMNPAEEKGGHYARCPKDKWNTHLKPYVMGDVETCYQARDTIQAKLQHSKTYPIPLADPNNLGKFRKYLPPSRSWLYNRIMSPASRLLMKMMGRGFYVSTDELSYQEQFLSDEVKRLRDKMKNDCPEIFQWAVRQKQDDPDWEFDLESKSQLKDILFRVLKFTPTRLTKNGQKMYGENPDNWPEGEKLIEYAATDKYTLNALAVTQPEVRPLQEYRKVHKMYTTYVRPLRNYYVEGLDKKPRSKQPILMADGCLHTSFLMTGTRGGRLSSKNPNLQNAPRDGLIKKMFVSRFGDSGCIYGADLNQIELRLMAAVCGDEYMVGAYKEGIDLHSLTASKIFHKEYEEYTKAHMKKLQEEGKGDEAKKLDEQRSIAKVANFLTGYGGGPYGLQNVLSGKAIYREFNECERIINSFFDGYPTLKKYLGSYKNFVAHSHVALSLFGRVRYFEEAGSDDAEIRSKALRAGANHLIQSTASDMMLICMYAIEEMMREEGLESLLVSTVHDSLVIDGYRSEIPKVHEIVDMVLNNIPGVLQSVLGPDYDTSWMIVPFGGDSSIGPNYHKQIAIGKNPDWDKLFELVDA